MDFSSKQDLPEEFRLPYGRLLLAYCVDIASKITEKARPDIHTWRAHRLTDPARPPDAEQAARLAETVSPADCKAVLAAMEEIFRQDGYLRPWDLERRLAERHRPDLSAALLDVAARFAAVDHQPEPMTDWHQKAFAGLLVAQAALYKRATGTPVAVFDGDISNMRGTNDLYYRLLCRKAGRAPEPPGGKPDPALMAQAQALTDRAVRILAAIAHRETGGEGCRNGGDELRTLVPGFPEDREKAAALVERIHLASEIATARMGLHDHPHAKPEHAANPDRNGFGNAVGWFWLPVHDIDFAGGAKQAEAETEGAKAALGVLRRREHGIYSAFRAPAYDTLPPPATTATPQQAAAYLEASAAAMAALEEECGIGPPARPADRPTPNLHRLAGLAGAQGFDSIPGDGDLSALVARAFEDSLTGPDRAAFDALDPQARRCLEMVAAHAPARDYVTRAYVGQDLAPLSEITHTVNESLRRRALAALPDNHPDRVTLERSGLFAIGASINTAGFNKHLGHEPTNTLLEHFNAKILTAALTAARLSPQNACIVNLGGGDFAILLQNAVPHPDGGWRIVKESDITTLRRTIAENIARLNDEPCLAFFRETFNKASKGPRYDRIGDVPDTRLEGASGLRLSTASKWIEIPPDRPDPGGLIAGQIRQHLENDKKTAPSPTPEVQNEPRLHPAPALL